MDALNEFFSAMDLDGALRLAGGVDVANGDVQQRIEELLESDWSAAELDRQALYNLLQNSRVIPTAEQRKAALLKALQCGQNAFILAGIVGAQEAADLGDNVKTLLLEVCCEPTCNATVAGRAATSLRGKLKYPQDMPNVLRMLEGAPAAYGEASAFIIENTWQQWDEEQLRRELQSVSPGKLEQLVNDFLSYKAKKAAGKFAWLGGGLQYIPNLVELDMQDRFPNVPSNVLNQLGALFDNLAKGSLTITRAQFLTFSQSKGDNLNLEDISQYFKLKDGEESIDIFHFIEGILALSNR